MAVSRVPWSLGAIGALALSTTGAAGAGDAPPGPHIVVETLAPISRVAGHVTDAGGVVRLYFDSTLDEHVLRSRLVTDRGDVIAEYVEHHGHPLTPGTYDIEGPAEPPSLWLAGVPVPVTPGADPPEWTALVHSEYGPLLRFLALELVAAAPGDGWTAPRRGLELPFQALQHLYHAPPDAVTLTADYLVTPEAGYLVTSQPVELVLRHNYLATPPHDPGPPPKGVRQPTDDAGRVGDCFGRCGPGCGSDWQHSWVGAPARRDQSFCVMDCNVRAPRCGKEVRILDTGNAVHTVCGLVNDHAREHDACVRTFGVWNPACVPSGVAAAAACSQGVGQRACWSYVGPHSQFVDYRFHGNQRDCCPPGWNRDCR